MRMRRANDNAVKRVRRRKIGDVTPDLLTVESLARAIHEDEKQASLVVFGKLIDKRANGKPMRWIEFEDLLPKYAAVRLEQARLLLNRIMR